MIRIRHMVLVGVGVCLLCAAAVSLQLSSESHTPFPPAITPPRHELRPVSLRVPIGSVGSVGQTTISVARGAQAVGTPASFTNSNSGIVGYRKTTPPASLRRLRLAPPARPIPPPASLRPSASLRHSLKTGCVATNPAYSSPAERPILQIGSPVTTWPRPPLD